MVRKRVCLGQRDQLYYHVSAIGLMNSRILEGLIVTSHSMVACSNYGIDYDAVTRSTLIKEIEPVRTFAGPPPDDYQQQAYGFAGQFNGINQLVCASPSLHYPLNNLPQTWR